MLRTRIDRMVNSLLLIMTLQATCLAHDLPNCKNSTVEQAWGAEYASQAKSFLVTLQKVVESGDSAKFARLVHYPVRINGTHVVKITKRSELTRKYASIMTSDVRQAILTQNPECLFANGQGVMIGNGQIWFQQESSGKMKVISINLP